MDSPIGQLLNYDLYLAIKRVGAIFFEEVARLDDKNLHVTFSDEKVNPFYGQTEQGLFLEYSHGHPRKVWTPWGYWQFAWRVSYSGDPWSTILPRILERLGATLFMPERYGQYEYGKVGPIYAIHRVDEIELPEPKVREDQNYLAFEAVNAAWNNMTERYDAEHASATQ